jgi:hypothetical protein
MANNFSDVGGFTYNFKNTATQTQNGIDFHFDWVHRTFCPNNSLSAWSDMPINRSLTILGRHRSSTDSNRAFSALVPTRLSVPHRRTQMKSRG